MMMMMFSVPSLREKLDGLLMVLSTNPLCGASDNNTEGPFKPKPSLFLHPFLFADLTLSFQNYILFFDILNHS